MRALLRQFGSELRLLAARGRTRFGCLAFAAVATLFALIFQFPAAQAPLRRLLGEAHYDPAAHLSGLTLALLVLRATVFLAGAPLIALVAGDIVAKDEEDGTLRMLLCRPVSRGRVLAIKWLASALYAVALPIGIGVLALALGLLFWGRGPLFVYGPLEGVFTAHPESLGLARYAIALPLLGLGLLPVQALAFTLSCHAIKPATAAIATITVFFADYLFRTVPYFHSFAHWFLTARIGAWVQVFQPAPPWERIAADYLFLAAFCASLFVVAHMRFAERDFKP